MSIMNRAIARAISMIPKRWLTADTEAFNILQRRGIHLLPVNYYFPTPDTRELGDEVWTTTSDLIGVDCNLEFQEALLAEFAASFIAEFRELPDEPAASHSYFRSSGFGGFDAAFAYSMVRKFKPSTIIEIGSGASTLLMADALSRNAAEDGASEGRIIAIEPHPRSLLEQRLPKRHELVVSKVQDVDLDFFAQLDENDILFIRFPLRYKKVSSPFRINRVHPVLGVRRPHTGIDLAAPTGTPVRAPGDGVVEFVGWQRGYGKTVIVDHGRGYTTLYAHLSRFARGLEKGDTLRRGEILAYVGSTGLSTGPHLHYEVHVDGKPHDPATVTLPGDPPLPENRLASFKRHSEPLLAQIDLLRRTRLALRDD